MGSENYHPIEYQLFYLNLRSNALDRVAAYVSARACEGATPAFEGAAAGEDIRIDSP